MRTRPWATGRYVLYGITQYYLPPDTSECAPSLTPATKLVLDIPTSGGMVEWVDVGYPAVHRPVVELAIF